MLAVAAASLIGVTVASAAPRYYRDYDRGYGYGDCRTDEGYGRTSPCDSGGGY